MKSNVELLKSRNMKSYVFPGNIEERILRIAGEPFPYMRTALFSEIVKDSERMSGAGTLSRRGVLSSILLQEPVRWMLWLPIMFP